jgi:hypothetical protein
MQAAETAAGALALALDAQSRCAHAEAERLGLAAATAAELEGDTLSACRARQVAAWAAYEQGEPGRGARALRRAQALAESPAGAERRGAVYHDLYTLHMVAGSTRTAESYFEKAAGFYAPARQPSRLAIDRAWGLFTTGRPREAAYVYAGELERVTDPALRLTARANLASSLAVGGQRDGALAAVLALREDLAGAGCDSAWGWYSLGLALHLLGEDRRGARSAVALARKTAARNGEESTRRTAAKLLREMHARG